MMERNIESSGGNSLPFGADPISCLSILNHVAAGVYAVNAEGICTSINQAALKLLGYAENECVGHDMHELMHSRHVDGSHYPVETCPLYLARLTGLPVHDMEETFWTKSGAPLLASCSSVPLVLNGDVCGTVITLNDLSARLAAERLLRQTEDEQREIFRQRDAAAKVEHEQALQQREASLHVERIAAEQLREQQQISSDQLVKSEKLAAMGRLAASISHEINNPLEAVTNLLYLVRQDDSLSHESDEYLRQAEQELGRVSEIVSQTLRFQRGSTSLANCVPEQLIDSVVALHQGRLHHSGINIQRQHRRSKTFRCAEGDIRQVLNNLVGNAIDAMREKGGTITVRTSPARNPRSGELGIRISVSDCGHGMPPSTATQIFEPFYTTKGAGGSGLGLWISNSIAKRHGGHLSVRSSAVEGRSGTTFSLFLPEPQAIS